MIGVGFRVVVRGQPATGATTALATVEMERRFGLGAVELFIGGSPRMEALYWLSWRSLHPDVDLEVVTMVADGTMVSLDSEARTDADRMFDEWLAGLEVFELSEDDAAVGAAAISTALLPTTPMPPPAPPV